VVGFLHSATPQGAGAKADVAAFRKGLAEAGYVEGRNLTIRFESAHNRYEALPALAAELVRSEVFVIFATGGAAAALAAKSQTSSIPIVFSNGSDPIEVGLVSNLSRPGENLTGVVFQTGVLPAKQLEMLHELLPRAATLGALMNAPGATADTRLIGLKDAAHRMGVAVRPIVVRHESEFEEAFATFARLEVGGVLVVPDPLLRNHIDRIVTLSRRYSLPIMATSRDSALAGLTASYGNNLDEVFRQAGIYTGKILSGTKPADLPVVRSDSLELVINTRVARELGVDIPVSLLARADEVIE
jgi:putative ABC transport system substrate-binding protein